MFHQVCGKNSIVFLTFSGCECGAIIFGIRVRYGGGGGDIFFSFYLMVKQNASKSLMSSYFTVVKEVLNNVFIFVSIWLICCIIQHIN